ncbi:MAG: hypothetical protein LRZ84_27170 [Desertifilum sp.]|nr:hypothetical protein [Desertifilum sp.]
MHSNSTSPCFPLAHPTHYDPNPPRTRPHPHRPRQQSPSSSPPTFLQGSGIIPSDWQLARQPLLTPQIAQIAFTNGINIIAHPSSITFTENIPTTNSPPALKIPDIACNYLQTQPHLNYQIITLTPRTFITFPDSEDNTARTYIARLLATQTDSGQLAVGNRENSSPTFTLSPAPHTCPLAISEVQLQKEGNPPQNAVLFCGSFSYPIAANSLGEKLEQLKAKIQQSSHHWQTYQNTLNAILQPQ